VVQHPLISNPLKINSLIKRQVEAGSWRSAARTGGAEPAGSAEVRFSGSAAHGGDQVLKGR